MSHERLPFYRVEARPGIEHDRGSQISSRSCWLHHFLGAMWILWHGPEGQADGGPLWELRYSWSDPSGLFWWAHNSDPSASHLLPQICHLRFQLRFLEAFALPLGGIRGWIKGSSDSPVLFLNISVSDPKGRGSLPLPVRFYTESGFQANSAAM